MDPHETKRLRTIATQVAERLGYSVEPKFSDEIVVTKGDHDVCLCWRIPCHPKDSIVISGQFPRWGKRGEQVLEPRDPLSITVPADSTAEHVEAEVRGRLLPGYLVQLEWVRAERAGGPTYEQEQDRVARLLCSAGAEPCPGRGHLQLPLPSRPERSPCAYIEVARYSNEVTIELRYLSPEQAARVICALAPHAAGAEG